MLENIIIVIIVGIFNSLIVYLVYRSKQKLNPIPNSDNIKRSVSRSVEVKHKPKKQTKNAKKVKKAVETPFLTESQEIVKQKKQEKQGRKPVLTESQGIPIPESYIIPSVQKVAIKSQELPLDKAVTQSYKRRKPKRSVKPKLKTIKKGTYFREVYSKETKQKVLRMIKQGKSYRQIRKETKIPISSIAWIKKHRG